MSFVSRLRWGHVEPRVQRVFEHFYAERGNVPNLFRVMSHRPELMTSFNAHFGGVMGEGTVSVRVKELLAVRVSMLNNCEYCLASHTVLAKKHGATDEELQGLRDLARSPFPPAERAALHFAEKMTLWPSDVTAADLDALHVSWTEPQIVEIACVIGLFNYLNRFAEAMGVEPTQPGEGGPER
jgi:uncharacterized peroxidase-related enzyme